MTGLDVVEVNVHVQGVKTPSVQQQPQEQQEVKEEEE